jgi:hypothetical protein
MSTWFWINKAFRIGIDQEFCYFKFWILIDFNHGDVTWDGPKKESYGKKRSNYETQSFGEECRNPSFGLVTKAKGVARVRAKRKSGVTSHTPGSVRKCEGVNPHTPKWTPMLGVGVPEGLPNLQSAIAGVKTPRFEKFFISLESYWSLDV